MSPFIHAWEVESLSSCKLAELQHGLKGLFEEWFKNCEVAIALDSASNFPSTEDALTFVSESGEILCVIFFASQWANQLVMSSEFNQSNFSNPEAQLLDAFIVPYLKKSLQEKSISSTEDKTAEDWILKRLTYLTITKNNIEFRLGLSLPNTLTAGKTESIESVALERTQLVKEKKIKVQVVKSGIEIELNEIRKINEGDVLWTSLPVQNEFELVLKDNLLTKGSIGSLKRKEGFRKCKRRMMSEEIIEFEEIVESDYSDEGERLGVDTSLFNDLQVPLTIRVGEVELTVGEIESLGENQIVTLEQDINEPVELYYLENKVAVGSLVVSEGKLGFKVLKVTSTIHG